MLKPILVSVFSLLSFGLVTSSPFFQQNLLTQSLLLSELQVSQTKSESNGLTFQYYNTDTEDAAPDASRGDTRRTSS
ncbi:hypothetical protein [Lyngbya sp. PCC 8106]|uniref:hypothetical protein n=1 Tax=Lyngbya sp. (strain PCC 8106) TaxID=313612 RepID=UPI0000EA9100|nr:hypothetical protein [Lyngbya sp. PCC 8106]EAW34007.1 hypothetical protein L8106_27781 [Lyngbya sp. PCC 8106]